MSLNRSSVLKWFPRNWMCNLRSNNLVDILSSFEQAIGRTWVEMKIADTIRVQHGGHSESEALDSVLGSRCFPRHDSFVSSVERNIGL